MPSFLELLQSSDGDDVPSSSASAVVPLDVLDSVKHEGGRRRRRRQRRNLAAGGVALVALAVPAFALIGGGGDEPEEVRSELADAPTPTTERDRPAATTSTTADPTEVLGVVIERPADEVPGATTSTTAPPARPVTTVPPTAPPATDPPLVCANSYDPACGNFSWSPQPAANQAMTASAPTGLTVAPGGTVPFDVVFSDPDAVPGFADDDTDGTIISAACVTDAVRYGPWTPPTATAGSLIHHVSFTAPGDAPVGSVFAVNVHASSRNGECVYDHFGSEGSTTVFITIADS